MARSPIVLLVVVLAAGCGSKEPTPDSEPPVEDQTIVAPDRPVSDLGVPSNSGRICKDATDCAPGDDCLLLTLQGVPTPTQKMCVMPCKEGTTCPHPAPNSTAKCFITWSTKRYCVWYCEYQGKSYDCPDKNAFQCVAPNATEPGVKICIPN